MDRVRRSADDEKRSYLDGVVYMIGALLGKQKCSHMIACRTGKMVQVRLVVLKVFQDGFFSLDFSPPPLTVVSSVMLDYWLRGGGIKFLQFPYF